MHRSREAASRLLQHLRHSSSSSSHQQVHSNKEKALFAIASLVTSTTCVVSATRTSTTNNPTSLDDKNGEAVTASLRKIHDFVSTKTENSWLPALATACDQLKDMGDDDDTYIPVSYSQEQEFQQCLQFHRSLLPEYRRRWDYKNSKTPTTTGWPRRMPNADEISALEKDLRYCGRSPNYRRDETYCDNLQFRIAVYYITHTDDETLMKKGFKLVKDLAERGHADAMCYYGIVINDGRVPGIDANPIMAVGWWRRAVELYRHVPSMYELAVALYTGEGVAEDEKQAFQYFRQAANTGHAPAAYMLGDCLLDGVGCERDRAEALDWLVTAAELGHRGARSRVLAVLELADGENYGRFTDGSRQTLKESVSQQAAAKEAKIEEPEELNKWASEDELDEPHRPASIERRYTIGGGSRNPVVLKRRITLVDESRTM